MNKNSEVYENSTFFATVGSVDKHHMQDDYDAISKHQLLSWSDTAWKGDRLSASIVVLSKQEPVNNLNAIVSDFHSEDSKISASQIKINSLKETKAYIGRGGSYSSEDRKVLVPDIIYSELPINIEANRVQTLWVSIDIPKDANPGTYKGTVLLRASDAEEQFLFDFQFEVLDIMQPNADLLKKDTFGFELWQYPYTVARYYGINDNELFGEKHIAILEKQLRIYKEAGGNSISVTIVEDPWNSQTYDPYPSMIKWIKRKDGSFDFDYKHFDKYVGLALSLGIDKQIKSFSLVPWKNRIIYFDENRGKMVSVTPRSGGRKWKKLWSMFLDSYVKHLEEKGWFDITYISMDERPLRVMKPVIKLLKQHTNSKGKRLKISGAMNYNKIDNEIMNDIDDVSIALIDIDMKGDRLRDFAAARRERSLTTTMYTCVGHYPNSFSLSQPVESAWTIWYAQSQGVDGYLRWALDAWVENPLDDVSYKFWESGDPFLVYPDDRNADIPVSYSTPRFERLKEGLRDVQKIRYLMIQDEAIADKIDKLFLSLGRVEGKINLYGAMCSGGEKQDAFILSEVHRMRDGLNKITKEFILKNSSQS